MPSNDVVFIFKHVFNSATTQGSWKQAPATTATTNNGFRSGGNYEQEQQFLPPITVNGNRQKPMVR